MGRSSSTQTATDTGSTLGESQAERIRPVTPIGKSIGANHPMPAVGGGSESSSPCDLSTQKYIWGAGRSQKTRLKCALANVDTLGLPGQSDGADPNTRISAQPGRIALFDNMFAKAGFDFVGLNETKWKGGDLVVKDNYAFLLPPTLGNQGVGIAIKLQLYYTLLAYHSYSSRVMRVRFTGRGRHLSVVVAYAPTNTENHSDEEREIFYKDLQQAYDECGTQDVKLVLMDGNIETGNNPQVLPGLMGKHAPPSLNPNPLESSNGAHFFPFCNNNDLCVGSSYFAPHKKAKPYIKSTFFAPNDNRAPVTIDHVLIDKRSFSCLTSVKVRHDLHISTTSTVRTCGDGISGHRLVEFHLSCKLTTRKLQAQAENLNTTEFPCWIAKLKPKYKPFWKRTNIAINSLSGKRYIKRTNPTNTDSNTRSVSPKELNS